MYVVGITGKAGAGKDYICLNYLVPMLTQREPYVIVSFADHFKFEAIVMGKLDREKVYGQKDKKTREYLQQRGTEKGRNVYGENIWVDILNEQLIQYEKRGIKWAFITDVRFPNEYDYVVNQKNGIVVKIDAPDRNAIRMEQESASQEMKTHVSETALDNKEFPIVINNRITNVDNVQKEIEDAVKIIERKLITGYHANVSRLASIDKDSHDCLDGWIEDSDTDSDYGTMQMFEARPLRKEAREIVSCLRELNVPTPIRVCNQTDNLAIVWKTKVGEVALNETGVPDEPEYRWYWWADTTFPVLISHDFPAPIGMSTQSSEGVTEKTRKTPYEIATIVKQDLDRISQLTVTRTSNFDNKTHVPSSS